jgi:heme-degrading monooxygenase HmoA
MANVLVQHKVGKWSEFEATFREDGERRRRFGSTGARLFRDLHDPENIFVVFEWDDVERAQRFVDDVETHEAMNWGTAGSSSQVYVAEELFEVDA